MKHALIRKVSVALLASQLLCSCIATSAAESPGQIIIKGQKLIDAGQFQQAEEFMAAGYIQYPENDAVITVYAESLYENHRLDEAEAMYRKALLINPKNAVAGRRISQIQEIRQQQLPQWIRDVLSVSLDKAGDVIVIMLGFVFANLTAGLWSTRNAKKFAKKTKESFLSGDYEDFADLLEIQLATNELHPLRESLDFMLDHKTENEALEILNLHVNTHQNLGTLSRMVKLAAHKKFLENR